MTVLERKIPGQRATHLRFADRSITCRLRTYPESWVRARIRAWRLHRRTQTSLGGLARAINPIVGGWINYYGAFRPSELGFTLNGINHYLVRWLMQKYKRFRRHQRRTWEALRQAARLYPGMFVHWRYIRP